MRVKDKPVIPRDGRPWTTAPTLPSFIGGFRSGTTLLANLLGLHPELAAWFETKYLCEALRWLRVLEDPKAAPFEASIAQPKEYQGFSAEKVASRMRWDMQQTALRLTGHVPSGKAPYERYPIGNDHILYSLEEGEAALDRWFRQTSSNPDVIAPATGELILHLGKRHAALEGCPFWINKTPEVPRFGHELRQCLGPCRMILLIRDGVEVVRSARNLGWASLEQLAFWWKGLIEESRSSAHPGLYLEVRYEDLLKAPEETLNRILRFLSLEPIGGFLIEEYERRLGHPLSPPSRNLEPLSVHETEVFGKVAGDLMRTLGYFP